jgi:hypothetical protein
MHLPKRLTDSQNTTTFNDCKTLYTKNLSCQIIQGVISILKWSYLKDAHVFIHGVQISLILSKLLKYWICVLCEAS